MTCQYDYLVAIIIVGTSITCSKLIVHGVSQTEKCSCAVCLPVAFLVSFILCILLMIM